MVAYSFKARFADPILAGTKAQTDRADRCRHARPGEQLQLYTGMRTKHCRLIARVKCLDVMPVRLTFHRAFGPIRSALDRILLGCDAMKAFAQADGFGEETGFGLLKMAKFWFETHGKGVEEIDFRGVVIRWAPLGSDGGALCPVEAVERAAGVAAGPPARSESQAASCSLPKYLRLAATETMPEAHTAMAQIKYSTCMVGILCS